MRAFDHTTVESAEAAVAALAAGGASASLIAGGADLLSLMKADLAAPTLLIDIKPARALRGVSLAADGVTRIGALTTLADIERDDALAGRLPILRAAAREAATPQIRNAATVGGNLMQRTRCWYYRGPYDCWQKGGETCFARTGQNKYHAIVEQSPCVSAYPSDLAPALLALDASIEIVSTTGQRAMPLSALLQPPDDARRQETTLAPGELITAITIPAQPAGSSGAFLKMMDRHAWAYALASAAIQIAIQDGVVTHARVVLGAVANVPYRAEAAETHLVGQPLSHALAGEAADRAVAAAQPLAHNRYKVALARELVRRGLLLAAGMEW